MKTTHRSICSSLISTPALCLAALALAASSANAVIYTWDGTADVWGSAHWDAGAGLVTFPAGNSNANTGIINAGTVTFGGNDTFGNDGTASSPVIQINGGTLASGPFFNTMWNLGLAGGTLLANGGVNASFPAFQLAGTVTVSGSVASLINASPVNANNAISIGGIGNGLLTFDVADVTGNASADLTINNILKTNAKTVGALAKSGAGRLLLTAANTYSGATTVNDGTLSISGAGTLGSGNYGAGITIGASGTLDYSSTADQTLSGVITGAGTLAKGNSGTLTLTGANNMTGPVSINQGVLAFAGAGTVGANTQISVASGGTLRFSKHDTFGDNNTSVTQVITVNGGTITNSGNSFTTLGSVTLNGGTINSTGGAAPAYPSFSLRGPITVGGSTASTISGGGANSQMTVGTQVAGTQTTFNVADATADSAVDLTVSVPLQNNAGGSTGIIKAGAGIMVLSAANTYTGNTDVNDGTLAFAGGGTLAAGSAISVASGATLAFARHDTFGNHVTAVTQTITVNGGTITNANNAFTTLGAVTLNGGTINSTGGAASSFPSFSLRGPITVGGSTASTVSGSGANSQMVIGTSTAGSQTIFNVANATGDSAADLTVSVPLQNNLDGSFAGIATGILKTGAGTLTLTNANLYTGATTVNAGTLLVSGSISGSATTVNTGGTLGGIGTVGALTLAGGTLAPGASPGVLSSGSATLSSGTFAIEINGTTLGSQYDQLSVTGTVSLSGASLSLSGSYLTTPAVTNDLFTILLNDGNSSDPISGTFAGLVEGAHVYSGFGQDYLISYVGGDGNDVVLTAVPEPGSAAMLVGGFAMLLGFRRRRN